MANVETEDFWLDLITKIKHEEVIPVIGPELLRTGPGNEDGLLYRALAQRILTREKVKDQDSVKLRHGHELNDALCAWKKQRGMSTFQNCYSPVHDELKKLLAEAGEYTLQPLRELASISRFNLFVTTTPDDLMARVLRDQRDAEPKELIYAPNLSSRDLERLSKPLDADSTAIFYLFGKMKNGPSYAIHDEDILEFLHKLQTDGQQIMEPLISKLRRHHLLLIGCNFPDWLTRFFIRLSNNERFTETARPKEFLNICQTGGPTSDRAAPNTQNDTLILFLECFSSDNTFIHPGEPREFVAELARRWRAEPPETTHYFINYTTNDQAAVDKLTDFIRSECGGKCWVYKTAIEPGQEWESTIGEAIDRCHVFIPILSLNAEEPDKTDLEEERERALKRSKKHGENPIIFLPVVVDEHCNGNYRELYRNAYRLFGKFHFAHAPGGDPDDALKKKLRRIPEQLRGRRSE